MSRPLYIPTTNRPPLLPGWAVVLLVTGFGVLCCLGGLLLANLTTPGPPSAAASHPATPSRTAPASQPASRPASHAASGSATPPPRTAGLNEPVRDGQFEFVVTSITCGLSSIGGGGATRTARGQFCEVSVTVRNVGTQSRVFDGTTQIAIGPDNARYSSDATAERYANGGALASSLRPGQSVTGLLVYDIPKGSRIVRLALHDSLFSGGATVLLG